MHRHTVSLIIAFLFLLTIQSVPAKINKTNQLHAEPGSGLRLNEISPWPADGTVWVEIINPTDAAVSLSGWSVEFFTGESYQFPDGNSEMNPGIIDLIEFEGLVIGTGGDGCVLKYAGDAVDGISWGNPETPETPGISIGPAIGPYYRLISVGDSFYETDDVIFRIPGTLGKVGSGNWVYRTGLSASPGVINPPPTPWTYSPGDGENIASKFNFSVTDFGWTTHTTIQVAEDATFDTVVHEDTVEGWNFERGDLPAGDYFWRLRGYYSYPDESGPWFGPMEFTRAPFDIDELIAEAEQTAMLNEMGIRLASYMSGGGGPASWLTSYHAIPGIEQTTQRKDTQMLCMDGCKMNGKYPWDSAQPLSDDSTPSHGYSNCAMASLSMMASKDNCSISQDRIAYYMLQEAGSASQGATNVGHLDDPWKDLNHGVNGGTFDDDIPLMVSWLYRQPKSASKNVMYHADIFYNNSPAMDSIAEFIADNRPIVRHSPGHATLIGGVGVIEIPGLGRMDYLQVYDTDTIGNIKWLSLESTKNTFNQFTFPPTTGRISRVDEDEIWEDSDADGIVDFDEIHRFKTDENVLDTDEDGVNDKEDMLGYMFDNDGTYAYFAGMEDFDKDGFEKEVDPDNDDPDDNSMEDGCEDGDGDGFLTPNSRETTCFNKIDDFEHVNPDCLRGYIKFDMGAHIIGPDYWINWTFIEKVEISNDGNMDGESYDHDHDWHYNLDYTVPAVGYARGSDSDSGMARLNLIYDEAANEYHLPIDSTIEDIVYTTEVAGGGFLRYLVTPPVQLFFDKDGAWPLGSPQDVNGGQLLKGRTNYPTDPRSHMFVTWEIWITPPTS